MIDERQAEMIIAKQLPGYSKIKHILFEESYIFLMAPSDDSEPPTFFKVNASTGAFTDMQPWLEPDPAALERAFLS